MKIYALALVLFLAMPLFFFSCGEDPVTGALLREAEHLMENEPDSAYTVLENVGSALNFSTAQRAEWNLLITQAMDKAKIKPENDSVIREALRFYTETHDPRRLMLAYYYAGRVAHTLGDAPQAQEHYLNAREKAIHLGDSLYLARINSNTGMLYLYQELPEEALPYLLETEKILSLLNDSTNLRYAARNLGRTCSILHKPESALFYYKKALTYTTIPARKVALLNEIVPLYIDQAKYDSAFIYIQEIRRLSGHSLSPQSDLVTGQYFASTIQPDSAHYYLMRCVDSEDIRIRAAACFHLYRMARERKDLENYTLYQTEYELLRDSIMENTYTEKLLQLHTLYNYEKKENEIIQEKLAHAEEKQENILLFSIATVAVLLLGLTLYRLRRQIKEVVYWRQKQETQEYNYAEQIHRNDLKIGKLRAKLKTQDKQAKKLQAKIEELEQKNREIEQKTGKDNAHIKELFASAVYQLFKEPNNKEITAEDKDEFVALIDKAYPTFEIKLRELCPDLWDDELYLCYLSKAGIPLGAIAIITQNSASAVSNKRIRLFKKIFGKNGNAKTFNEEIRKIN